MVDCVARVKKKSQLARLLTEEKKGAGWVQFGPKQGRERIEIVPRLGRRTNKEAELS